MPRRTCKVTSHWVTYYEHSGISLDDMNACVRACVRARMCVQGRLRAEVRLGDDMLIVPIKFECWLIMLHNEHVGDTQ